MTAREKLLQEIKNELKRNGASVGEICTELLRLEKASLIGLAYYLAQLTGDATNGK